MRSRTAQVSVDVNVACEYSARAGFVRVSVDSGRDEARERARASMMIPRSAGWGHDWFFSFSASSVLLSSSWFPSGVLWSVVSASCRFRSVDDDDDDDDEEEEEEEEVVVVVAEVGVVEEDACGEDAGMSATIGVCCRAGADPRDTFSRLCQDSSLSESGSISLRRRFVRERAGSGGSDAKIDATSGSDSMRGVVARRLVRAPVTEDDNDGRASASSR